MKHGTYIRTKEHLANIAHCEKCGRIMSKTKGHTCSTLPVWNKNLHICLNTGRTHFKKGLVPWNKDKIGVQICSEVTRQKMSDSQKRIGNKPPIVHLRDEKNGHWKGDDVGYLALHDWIRSRKGKAQFCINCEKTIKETRIEWANISHEYKRDVNDFVSLCCSCHSRFDKNKLELKNYGS